MKQYKIHFGCDDKGYRMYIRHPIPIFNPITKKTNPYHFICPNCGFVLENNKRAKGVITINGDNFLNFAKKIYNDKQM